VSIVAFTRLDELPLEATRDRVALKRNGVVSGAFAPMVVDDRVVGVLLFATRCSNAAGGRSKVGGKRPSASA
jgi:hypothetical protein